MTPGEFIDKWRVSELKESSAAQEHFIDLCRLLGEPPRRKSTSENAKWEGAQEKPPAAGAPMARGADVAL